MGVLQMENEIEPICEYCGIKAVKYGFYVNRKGKFRRVKCQSCGRVWVIFR